MGFMDRSLWKSEERVFKALTNHIRSLGLDEGYELVEIGCAEQIGFSHLGLKLSPIDSQPTYYHRCRNSWFISSNQVGLRYSALPWTNVDLVDIATALAVGLNQANRKTTDEKASRIPHGLRTENKSLLETQLGLDALAEYVPRLVSAGINEAAAKEMIGPTISTMLFEWALYFGGGKEEESDLGSKWLDGVVPSSGFAKGAVQGIEARSKDLISLGVRVEEIAEYWNQNFFQRYSVYAMSVVNALRTTEALRQKCEVISPEDVLGCSESFARVLVVTCQRDSEQVTMDQSGPLPPEAYSVGLELQVEFKSKLGIDKYMQLASNHGANYVARTLLKDREKSG